MMKTDTQQLWTIGHSTRSLEHFAEMLQSFDIEIIVDVRSFPRSRKYPQFNKENLEISLPEKNMQYTHLKLLGGRRPVKKDSKNTGWKHPAFRGYADYMETNAFKNGMEELEDIAIKQKTAYMCSEALWWRCHRAMISDYLKSIGWMVHHIMEINKSNEHRYTQPAKIINGKLSYHSTELF